MREWKKRPEEESAPIAIATLISVGVLVVIPALWLRGQPPFGWYTLRSAPFPPGIGKVLLWCALVVPLKLLVTYALCKCAPSTGLLVPSEAVERGPLERRLAKILGVDLTAHWAIVGSKVFLWAGFEECICRIGVFQGIGFMASTFLSDAIAFGFASVVSAFVFTIMHTYGDFVPRLWGGMLFCLLLRLTGSVVLIVLVHAVYNLAICAILRMSRRVGGAGRSARG